MRCQARKEKRKRKCLWRKFQRCGVSEVREVATRVTEEGCSTKKLFPCDSGTDHLAYPGRGLVVGVRT